MILQTPATPRPLTLQGGGVDEADGLGDAGTQTQRVDVAQLLCHLQREAHNVVLADGDNLHRVRVLVVVRVVVRVMRDQLFRCGVPESGGKKEHYLSDKTEEQV